MRILASVQVEDCFDGSRVYRYELDQPWSAERIRALRALGELDYYVHFPRPFFRLRTRAGVRVSGMQAEAACRVILPSANPEALRQDLELTLTAAAA